MISIKKGTALISEKDSPARRRRRYAFEVLYRLFSSMVCNFFVSFFAADTQFYKYMVFHLNNKFHCPYDIILSDLNLNSGGGAVYARERFLQFYAERGG